MPSQLRIYKIRPDQWDAWLAFFRDKVVPLHAKFGIPIRVAWKSVETSDFVWVRDFSDDEPVEEQEKKYVTWDERQRLIGDESKRYVESMNVHLVELVYQAG